MINIFKKQNLKIKTKAFSKFLMIFFSVIITLLFLELFLRITGAIYLSQKNYSIKNVNISESKNKYTILCIGESTTAGVQMPEMNTDDISYPTQLYKKLNILNAGINFQIFNEGIPGATTLTLLTRLEKNLDKYKPDMVICMIGTNDTGITASFGNSWYNKILSGIFRLRIMKVFVQGPLKFLKYHKGFTIFEKDNNDVNQYFCDKLGHYTIDIDPAIILKRYGFPGNDINLKKSMEHFNRGRIVDAVKEADTSLKKHPDSLMVKLYLAVLNYEISDFQKALDIYKEILNTKTDDPVLYIKLAKCYEMQGKFSDAEKIYIDLIKKWPDDYNVNIALTSLYMIKDTLYQKLNYPEKQITEIHEKIIKSGENCLRLKPDNLLGFLLLGKFYYSVKNYSKAVESFNKAYELENKNNYTGKFDFDSQPARYLSSCYEDMGEFKKSESILQPLVKKFDNPVILRYLAVLNLRMNNANRADMLFQKATEIDSKKYISSYRENYRLICNTVINSGCKMLSMEHPIRSTAVLNKILEGIDKVVFVSNEWNFKNALSKESYSEFFSDIYAGDFGHCTLKGNQIIADNLVPVILKESGIKVK